MARTLYACGPSDVVAKVSTTGDGDYRPDATPLNAYTTRTGSTQLTDLQTLAGSATATLTADVNGRISFYGPDGYKAGIWVGVGTSGARSVVWPADVADRLDAAETTIGGLAPADLTGYQTRSEKGAASGYAGLDTATLVPRARLGSGTADSTTYLRGDGTWAAVAAGGGGVGADTIAPTQVNNLVASNTDVSVTLTWDPSSDNVGVAGYHVYQTVGLSGGGGTPTTQLVASPSASTRTYSTSSLSPGTSYDYSVTAFDVAGNESLATHVAFTTTAATDSTPPSVPTGLSSPSSGTTTISLAWNAAADTQSGVASYNVYQGTATGFVDLTTPVANATGTSVDITGLTPGTTYKFRVSAIDGAGNESQAGASFTASTVATGSDTIPPSQVTGLATSNVQPQSVTLAWAAATDNSGSIATYNIYRALGAGGATALVGSAAGSRLTYAATGLAAATQYTFQVAAVDPSGNVGTKSTAVTVTTAAASGKQIQYGINVRGDSVGVAQNMRVGDRNASNGWQRAPSDTTSWVDAAGNATDVGITRSYYGGSLPTAWIPADATGGFGTLPKKRANICWKGNGFTPQNILDGLGDVQFCRYLNSIPAGWEVGMTWHHEPNSELSAAPGSASYAGTGWYQKGDLYRRAQIRLGALLEGRAIPTGSGAAKDPAAPAVSLNTGVKAYNAICYTIWRGTGSNAWTDCQPSIPQASDMDAGAILLMDAYQNAPPAIDAVAGVDYTSLYPTPTIVWQFFFNSVLSVYGYDIGGHGYGVGEWMAPPRNNDPSPWNFQAAAIDAYLTYLEGRPVTPRMIMFWENPASTTSASASFTQWAHPQARRIVVQHALGQYAI